MSEASASLAPAILIVEDEWLIREVIARYLESHGWAVLEACSGEEAAEILANGHSIDVLFTDIRLGGLLNGWDVAEAFRRSRPDAPVIYTSGNALPPQRDVAGSVFIAKPYKVDAVLRACEHARNGVKAGKYRDRNEAPAGSPGSSPPTGSARPQGGEDLRVSHWSQLRKGL
jgi:CheY-like chemotaxis protein